MRDWHRFVRDHLALPAMTDRRDERIVAELAAHLEETWHEARARGDTEEEADALVRATLGDRKHAIAELLAAERQHLAAAASRRLERTEEALRQKSGGFIPLADHLRDFRLALRTLAKKPLFTAVVVFVLALGIGATSAIFTLVNAIILSPLPFPDPGRLVSLGHSAPRVGQDDVGTCAAWHFTYTDENRVFDELGMAGPGRATVTGDGEPEAVPVLRATSGLFRAIRMNAIVGRNLLSADEDPDGPAIVLLSHAYWRSRFGGDPAVVGQTLQVDGVPSEIVGVLPPTLRALGWDPALVMPLRFRKASLFVGNVGYTGVARLKDGVTIPQAEADMARMLPLALEKFPGGPVIEFTKQAGYEPKATLLKDALVGDVADLLWVLLAGVFVVLLIACANVANLLLVRAGGRTKEMAIRAAMGAGRDRLAWEYIKEGLLLGLMGGLVGLGIAEGGLRALVAIAPTQLPRIEEVTIDVRVLLFTVAISLGAALLFGVFPLIQQGQHDLIEALKQGGHADPRGRGRSRLRNALAIGQVALVVVLLVASGLVFRSVLALRRVDPGFSRADDVLVFRVPIAPRLAPDANQAALTQEAIARRLEEIAGVTSVGVATALPMMRDNNINPLYVEGQTVPGKRPPASRRHKWIGAGFFETLGIPLRAGRAFNWTDIHNRIPAVVMSESLARDYWGSAEGAIGRRVAMRPDGVRWYEVIGVVGDVREDGVGLDPVPMVYWPQVALALWEGEAADSPTVFRVVGYAVRSDRVRTPGFLNDVRRAVWSVNSSLPLVGVANLSDLVDRSTARTSFTLRLLGVAALAALIIGLVGVYGVISYGVSQRTLELGMRMALGAGSGRVKRMVLRQGLILATVGVAIGLGLALLVTDGLSGLLFGVRPTDPLTFAAVAAALTFVVLIASYVPARRASRVDPLVVLRAE